MKTKETLAAKTTTTTEKTLLNTKTKSLRPMRSLVAKRSFKPKTIVATLATKEASSLRD